MNAQKIGQGHYIYRGYEIEHMDAGQWNIKTEGADFWGDARNTFSEAKIAIDSWIQADYENEYMARDIS